MDRFEGFNLPEYTQAPNDLFDLLLPQIDSLAELKVLLFAIRKTLGWHQEGDHISLSQFMRGTGLSRQSVITGINACLQRGTLRRIEHGKRGTRGYALSLRPPLVQTLDQSKSLTSQEFRPVLVKNLDQSLVQTLDTQKKPIKKPIQKKPCIAEAEKRPEQLLWDALKAAHGYEPSNASGRGAWNKTIRLLRDSDVSPEEYPRLLEKCRGVFPNLKEITPATIAKYVDMLRNHKPVTQGGRAVDRSALNDLSPYIEDAENAVIRG